LAIGIYVVAFVATVVGVDILIFRHHVWARLLANIGIVLVFAAFYLPPYRRAWASTEGPPRARFWWWSGLPTMA
jgi:hypothetical protein